MMRFMEANRGHGDDPKVGLFWYDETCNDLIGVVTQPVRDFNQANTPDGRVTVLETHIDVWFKQQEREIRHNNWDSPFIGSFEGTPRGRIYYHPGDDRFEISVGPWYNKYPDVKQLVLEEFNLPEEKAYVEYEQ